MVEFGTRLKQLRVQHNLTQKELGQMVGVKNSIISFYETGERNPSPEINRLLSYYLHVTSDYLMGIDTNPSVDVSGLTDEDVLLVNDLVRTLREKNKLIK